MPEPITVHYFERKRGPQHFSLERVFADVRTHLPADIRPVVLKCPHESKGILNRLRNMLWARRNAGQINHITGDSHYLALALPKKGTLLTIHDCVSLIRYKGLRRYLLWLFWYCLPIKRVQALTAITSFTKEQVLTFVGGIGAPIRVIHDPVAPHFRWAPKAFNARDTVLLHVGTGWNKNLSRVAEALRGLHCRLEIVGPLNESQRQHLQKSGVVYRVHEGIPDSGLAALYQTCDMVVFTSLYEGFGLPIVEAQATGRPVLTSNRCSMPEVAGGAACLVDPESVESIRAGILKIIQDVAYREELISKGIENVKRFAPEKIAAQYAELYRSML